MYQLTSNLPFIIVAYFIFALLILFGVKKVYLKENKNAKDIFKMDETNYLRGIAALMVLFTHLAQKLVNPGLMFWYWFFGYLSVGFFMFASGYASYIQFQRKGKDVFKGYVIKRVARLYIPFLIVDTIFALCFRVSPVNYLKTLGLIRLAISDNPTEWTPVWFIFVVFYLGIVFYISYKYLDEKKAMILDFALTIFFIIVMSAFGFGFWWYNTALAYFYGIVYAKYKDKITEIVQKKIFFIVVLVSGIGLAGIIFYMSKGHYTFVPQSIAVILSIICIVWFFSIVEIRRNLLQIIGEASLELFLVQGLRALYFGNNALRPGYQMVIWIIGIVTISIVLNRLDNAIFTMLFRKRVNKNG